MEVVHPLAFPVFVFQLFDFVRKTGAQQPMTSVSPHRRVSPGSGSNTGVSCVSWKVIETAPASINASLISSAFAPVVFSFNWIHGMAKLFIYQ